ncbi:hypothetical protein NCCP2222_19090 [Sporosarcina sp. NCCP-2222]|nr:hypothetical protein NCCP2222_19090 [Sporosarcina sp. NCCP-2222]
MTEEEAKKDFSDPLRRLANNHYAMEKARERLRVAIEAKDNKEIYTAIGELLLWVLTTEEWHWNHDKPFKKRRNIDDRGQLLFGLRFAYNAMKHNMNFYEIHFGRSSGFTFPFSFPVRFAIKNILWIKADEKFELSKEDRIFNEKSYKEQLLNYKRYIEGKDVSITFDKAMEFLHEEYERIK